MPNPVALITGASGGVGRACALALASGDPPCDVALQFNLGADAALALAVEIQASGRARAQSFQSNLGDAGAAARLVETTATAMGPPAILLHAAGHMLEKPLAFTKSEEWDALFEVHAISAAALAKAMMRYLRKSDRGRIVLVGSLAGAVGLGNGAAYSAAKGALQGLCKCLALETARWKTTVNVIAPGYIETAMTTGHDADRREHTCNQIPLRRMGIPEEVAALAGFLCSPQASYVTGQTIIVDGGMSLG